MSCLPKCVSQIQESVPVTFHTYLILHSFTQYKYKKVCSVSFPLFIWYCTSFLSAPSTLAKQDLPYTKRTYQGKISCFFLVRSFEYFYVLPLCLQIHSFPQITPQPPTHTVGLPSSIRTFVYTFDGRFMCSP